MHWMKRADVRKRGMLVEVGIAVCLVSSFFVGKARAAPPDQKTIKDLRAKMERMLEEELTEKWYPRAIDKELGGFHQNFAKDWSKLPDENRFLVYQARMTWTAAAYAEFSEKHRKEFQEYAKYGADYLHKTMQDQQPGGFHFLLKPDGSIDPAQGTEKHVYGTAFALFAESLADPFRTDLLGNDFDWLERNAHDDVNGGYFEAMSRSGRPIMTWEPRASSANRTDRLGVYYGYKSMNSHIHLLEALTSSPNVDGGRGVWSRQRLKEVFLIVRDKIAVEPGALNLYFTRDWKPVPAHDSFGHDVETAYLLIEAGKTLGMADERTWKVARSLVDHALDWGWDDENGGFYDKGDAFGGQAYDTKKVWWTQAEGLNALMLMHTEFGEVDDRYWKAFLKQWSFIEKYMIDPVNGGWFEETTKEGKLIGDGRKAHQWKANYHTSRALMNVSRMLESLEVKPNAAQPQNEPCGS